MCDCSGLVHRLLPPIRSLKCSGLSGSGQVFTIDTKTFLFLLRGNVLLYPQEECSQGIWCTLQKCRTSESSPALKQACIFRNRNTLCSLASLLSYFGISTSLTSLRLRARPKCLRCWRVWIRCRWMQRSTSFWKDPHWSMSPELRVTSCSAL